MDSGVGKVLEWEGDASEQREPALPRSKPWDVQGREDVQGAGGCWGFVWSWGAMGWGQWWHSTQKDLSLVEPLLAERLPQTWQDGSEAGILNPALAGQETASHRGSEPSLSLGAFSTQVVSLPPWPMVERNCSFFWVYWCSLENSKQDLLVYLLVRALMDTGSRALASSSPPARLAVPGCPPTRPSCGHRDWGATTLFHSARGCLRFCPRWPRAPPWPHRLPEHLSGPVYVFLVWDLKWFL